LNQYKKIIEALTLKAATEEANMRAEREAARVAEAQAREAEATAADQAKGEELARKGKELAWLRAEFESYRRAMQTSPAAGN
jgi:hypothetical protein